MAALEETKVDLAGRKKVFSCREIVTGPGAVVALFVSDRVMNVAGVTLPVGTVTFGHFWVDRPYNVYHWMTPTGRTLGHYFNLAQDTSISPGLLFWRDLTLDVLAVPGRTPRVLDEDELPTDLCPEHRARIDVALQETQAALPELLPWLEAQADVLWPKVFASKRVNARRP